MRLSDKDAFGEYTLLSSIKHSSNCITDILITPVWKDDAKALLLCEEELDYQWQQKLAVQSPSSSRSRMDLMIMHRDPASCCCEGRGNELHHLYSFALISLSEFKNAMQRPRESSVVTLLRGGSIPEISPAAFKKQRNAFIKWNQLAYYFPLLAIPAIIIGFIICRYAFNYLAGYIFAGSVLSLLSEFLIIGSYVQLKSWRKHPSRLLLYHSFTNAALAIVTILNALRAGGSDRDGARDDNPDSRWCMTLSFFTQLSFFAGECWLFVVSIDLVTSLSNPFSSLHGNLLKYKFFVWFASFISAVTLMTMHRCQGVTTDHMCWLHVEDLSSGCLWAFVIAWVTVYYVFSSAVLMYAFFRISRGLESTYATRLSCVKKHLNVLVAYIGYAILLLLLYIFYIVSEAEENDGNEIGDTDTPRFIEHILGMLLGCRGVVDGLLWFKLHRVPSSQGKRATSIGGRILSMVSASAFMNKNTSSRSAPLLPDGDPSCTVSDRADQSTVDDDRREKNVSRASGNLANRLWNGGSFISGDMDERESGVRASSFAIPQRFSTAGDKYRNSVGVLSQGTVSIVENTDDTGNDDDDDDLWVDFSLNPQLNMALRQEVLHFVTQGILQSLHRAASVETSFSSSEKSFHGEEKSLSGSVGDDRIRAMRAVTSSNSTRPTGDISVDHIPGSSVKEFVDQCKSISIETSVDSFSGTRKSDSKASPDEVTSAYDYTFKLDEKHYFRDRFPLLFRKLRSLVDISDEWYAHQISLPARERLAEGSSGAFMFFCGEGEFMVKTISFQESLALCSILERYITHLSNNPCSLLVRFLGLHELTMYRQTFYFVVMRNIFPPSATINLKYDIKGSWVNRSASGLMPPGTKSYCQHCGYDTFIYAVTRILYYFCVQRALSSWLLFEVSR